MQTDRAQGGTFDDLDVADCYRHRPPYAPALFQRLLTLTPGRARALDLGCGPGKIACVLADHFSSVDAVDPAAAMIVVGRERYAERHPNISWITAPAESAPIAGPYDLVTAGTSLHWMHHEVVFPRMEAALAPAGWLAVIDGDGAYEPPWAEEWPQFLEPWLIRMGAGRFDARGFDAAVRSYASWLDAAGDETFTFIHTSSIEAFIACEHSRATFTRSRMGQALARAFDDDLRAFLAPYASDGVVAYPVRSRLIWGRPRLEAAI